MSSKSVIRKYPFVKYHSWANIGLTMVEFSKVIIFQFPVIGHIKQTMWDGIMLDFLDAFLTFLDKTMNQINTFPIYFLFLTPKKFNLPLIPITDQIC